MEKIQQKYQNKNTLQGFGCNTYSKNSKYKKKNFLSFLYIKGLDIKMSLISAKGYENAGVGHLIIKKLVNWIHIWFSYYVNMIDWIQRVVKMFLLKILSWQILLIIVKVKKKRYKGNIWI